MVGTALAKPMCAVCSDPGRCCRDFALYGGNGDPMTMWLKHGTALHALVRLAENWLPMLPTRQEGPYTADSGEQYIFWRVGCPEILPNGRCGIYETRPQLCRDFEPGSGQLCVYHSGGSE